MWHFFLVHIPMSSYTTRSGWRLSVLELRTGRKVRNCGFLTICVHVSLSTYLSITRPSCNMSDRFYLIFGLLVGRWHPHLVTLNIWHCCSGRIRTLFWCRCTSRSALQLAMVIMWLTSCYQGKHGVWPCSPHSSAHLFFTILF